MHKFAPIVLFVLAACGGGSRADECEIADCDQAIIDACIDSVEACETAGVLVDTCVDSALAVNETACEVGGTTTDTGA